MKRLLMMTAAVAFIGSASLIQASPQEDLKAFQAYFLERFPNVPMEEFANGVYSIDAASRE